MNRTNLLAVTGVLLLCLLVFPADARRYKARGFSPKTVDSMMAFKPALHIGLIREGNEVEFSDSFSSVCVDAHVAVLRHYSEQLRLRDVFISGDDSLEARIARETEALFLEARSGRYLARGFQTPAIDSVAKGRGMRYIMLLHNAGFIRTKANYRAEDRKSIVPGLLSLGTYIPVTIPSASYLRLMILDLESRRTLFFSDQIGPSHEQSPASQGAIESQFRALLYFVYPL